MADATRWLPTLEQARAQGLDLPDAEPQELRKYAAVIVLAGAVRRDTWDDVVDAQEASMIRLREAPADPSDYQERSRMWVVGAVPGRIGRFRVRHSNDRPVGMCELYAPTLPIVHSFEGALEQLAHMGLEPPEELRCLDLRPRSVGASAYRGGGKQEQADFFGFSFGDAIEKAASAVDQLGVRGTIFLLNVRAYAWPFLWLRYQHEEHLHEMIVAPARDGTLRLAAAPQ